MRYIGKAFVVGIPARDLSDIEAAMYGKADLLASGLYEESNPASVRVSGKARKNLIENVKHSDLESEEV